MPEPEGRIPDELWLAAGGVKPEETALLERVGVSLGIGRVRLAVSEGVGTLPDPVGRRPEEAVGSTPDGMRLEEPVDNTPDGRRLEMPVGRRLEIPVGSTPDGMRPDETSDAMLDARLLAGGRGADAVPVGSSETKLDTMLGRTDPGTPDNRLETSETKEETRGGRTPDGAAVGEGELGAVGPAVPEGRTPETSETSEDKTDGRFKSPEDAAASEVGIAPELNTGVEALDAGAPVPSAVVIPTTIPPEDAWTDEGSWLDGDAGAGVGCNRPLVGRRPVEPTTGSRTDESRPPTSPWELVG